MAFHKSPEQEPPGSPAGKVDVILNLSEIF